MNRIAFIAGYSGHTPEQLRASTEALGKRVGPFGAIVLDIRKMPASRWQPQWGKGRLSETLFPYYEHVPDLGNVNYKEPEKGIQIADLAAGIQRVEFHARRGFVPILLCACKEAASCHRTVVADALRAEGWDVWELLWVSGGEDANAAS